MSDLIQECHESPAWAADEIERLTAANDFNCKTLEEMEVLLLAEQAKVAKLEAKNAANADHARLANLNRDSSAKALESANERIAKLEGRIDAAMHELTTWPGGSGSMENKYAARINAAREALEAK